MNKSITAFTGVLILMLSACVTSRGAETTEEYVESRRVAMEVPGLAAGTVGQTGIEWAGYFGTMDGENPVDADTLFNIASISKLFIATAVLQEWEAGRIDLDADIQNYLPFPVRSPRFPDEPITIRYLMTHRSSIRDRYALYMELYTIDQGGGDYPGELGDFLQSYFDPEGVYYSEENFTRKRPGRRFEYSNYASALLAHIVEQTSGETFARYCRIHIFAPLGMNDSYFLLDDVPELDRVAIPFDESGPLPHYSYPDYPAGSLRTTLEDLGKFAAFYLYPDRADSAVLSPETIEMAWQPQRQSGDLGEGYMGLIWVRWSRLVFGGVGHSGGDPGVSTFLALYPDTGSGTIVLMNGNPTSYWQLRQIVGRLKGHR